ncbi:MAG: hypothetical protein SF123_09580 [Chloroflexota bacterium]|nr:hypothetical protein [Chloroflexota bacterium]
MVIEEFAKKVGMTTAAIRKILLSDQEKPEEMRRIPGARKIGGKHRGIWDIPESAVDDFERLKSGRPHKPD